MPPIVLLTQRLNVAAGTEYASVDHVLNVETTAVNTVDHALSVTTYLQNANSASWRLVGAKLEMDLGAGLEEIPAAQVGSEISISESLDGFGDTISFSLLGRQWSPWASDIVRGQMQIRLTGYLGTPGRVESRVLFDGYINSASMVADPPSVRIESFDSCAQYVGKRLFISIDPGSQRTRQDIFETICEDYAIEIGSADWGSDEGGRIFKPLSEGGDVELLDWLRDFVRPIGRVIYFADGKIHVARARTGDPVRTLQASDMLRDFEVTLPETTNANIVTATGVVYEYAQTELGKVTRTSTQSYRSNYAPRVAVTKQAASDGALTATGFTQGADSDIEFSRVITRDTLLDGTVVGRRIEVWSWYARKAAPQQQDASGVRSHNSALDVYQYADGTWRSETSESFRLTKVIEELYVYSASGFLVSSTATAYYHHAEIAIAGELSNNNPIEVGPYQACYITEYGTSWEDPVETLSLSVPVTEFHRDYRQTEDGRFDSLEYRTRKRGVVSTGYPSVGVGVIFYEGRLVYGIEQPESLHAEWNSATGSQVVFSSFGTGFGAQPSIGLDVIGGVHYLPRTLAKQEAQQTSSTVKDAVQIALNGERTYYIHDEGAETIAELRTLAWEELREQGHWPVNYSLIEDLTTHKGVTHRILRPELGIEDASGDGLDFLVWSVDRTLNLNTMFCRMRIGARYFPPELTD